MWKGLTKLAKCPEGEGLRCILWPRGVKATRKTVSANKTLRPCKLPPLHPPQVFKSPAVPQMELSFWKGAEFEWQFKLSVSCQFPFLPLYSCFSYPSPSPSLRSTPSLFKNPCSLKSRFRCRGIVQSRGRDWKWTSHCYETAGTCKYTRDVEAWVSIEQGDRKRRGK